MVNGGPVYATDPIVAVLIVNSVSSMKQLGGSMRGPARFVVIKVMTALKLPLLDGIASFNWSK